MKELAWQWREKKLFNIGKESNKNSHKKSSHATLITVISQVNLWLLASFCRLLATASLPLTHFLHATSTRRNAYIAIYMCILQMIAVELINFAKINTEKLWNLQHRFTRMSMVWLWVKNCNFRCQFKIDFKLKIFIKKIFISHFSHIEPHCIFVRWRNEREILILRINEEN